MTALIGKLRKLTDDLERMLHAALDQAPGAGSPAWTKMLAQYEVTPLDDDSREDLLGRMDLVRGAVPDEVTACAEAIVAQFVATVGDPKLAAAAMALNQTLEFTYLAHATTRPSSMFAYQAAKAKQHESLLSGIIHRCEFCAGPRLVERQPCSFCGQ